MVSELGTVARLRRYPVKSMLGEDIDATTVRDTGLAGDRGLALIDRETGRIASAKDPRRWRDLLTVSATLDGDRVRLTLPDGTRMTDDDPDLDAALSALLGRSVALIATPPEDATLDRAVPEQVLAAGVTTPVEVRAGRLGGGAPPGTFFDYSPVHLVTVGTLDAIGTASPQGHVDAIRYRPNLVIAGPTTGYAENELAGRHLAIGDELVLRVTIPTPRCAIPTLVHGELPRDTSALRVPARDNRVESVGAQPCVGAYAEVVRPGPIRRGDPVRLTD